MHSSQSTLLTGSLAKQLAQTAGIPIDGPSQLNTLVPWKGKQIILWPCQQDILVMPMDNAYVTRSCAFRCQFVMCNMHMQSWQAASLNALQMARPAYNTTICFAV